MDPYVGEIRLFAGKFEPRGWAFCNGQLLPIPQNTVLFSILGNRFGGDGRTNFALPNLQGSVPLGTGAGPGLTPRNIAAKGGSATVTLLDNHVPTHTHDVACGPAGTQTDPTGRVWGDTPRNNPLAYTSLPADVPMGPLALDVVGGSQPHANLQPYVVMNYIIALEGIYPNKP